MKQLRRFPVLAALVALSSPCFPAAPAAQQGPPSQGQAAPGPAAAPASQGLGKVCLDVQTGDDLTRAFADRLQEAIAASGALTLASTGESCSLQLHVPGNLLRFETAGGVMVSTVVIVTSQAGRYLSTSIAACQASNLEPCAVRAVGAAKLALLMNPSDGT
jgi:hypothetical protein